MSKIMHSDIRPTHPLTGFFKPITNLGA